MGMKRINLLRGLLEKFSVPNYRRMIKDQSNIGVTGVVEPTISSSSMRSSKKLIHTLLPRNPQNPEAAKGKRK